MPSADPISRRALLGTGALLAIGGLTGCTAASRPAPSRSPAASPTTSATPRTASSTPAAATSAPSRVVYLFLFDKGQWSGPRNADGSPSLDVLDSILQPRSGEATPLYARIGNAGTDIGTPSAEELSVLGTLKSAGVRCGLAINTLAAGKSGKSAPTPDDLVGLGRRIKMVSDAHGGLWDWLFLDHASELTPAGSTDTDTLQQVIDGLTQAGWPQVMINASTFNESHFHYLPERTWAMARAFGVMGQGYAATVPGVVRSGTGAITSSDEQFVDYVHSQRRGTSALLKLEVPGEVQRFAKLSVADQSALLRLWAQAGAQKDFHIIYPLFLGGYDSSGTLTEQRQLMQQYG